MRRVLHAGELPDQRLEPPSSKVQIDVRLDEVVLRALEKKPELRYQQASVLKTQVETILSAPPPSASFAPITPSSLDHTRTRKHLMSTPNQKTNELSHGKLALALCLGGTVLAVVLGLLARMLGYHDQMWAYLLFAAFQIAAIVVGYRARREPLGRASVITASILLLLSLGFLA